jgi:hypothetical protein
MKRLVTFALAALTAPSVFAQSSVTLYGILDEGVMFLNNSGGASGGKKISLDSTNGINSSRWGFKGSEDLGGGLQATIKTKRVGDGGVDVVAIKRTEGALIQCKSSTVEDKELGWEGVRDVSAGRASYAARYPGITFSMVAVTNRRFNQAARHQAGVLNVELIEGNHLEEMLALHPMKRGELERFLLAGWGAV